MTDPRSSLFAAPGRRRDRGGFSPRQRLRVTLIAAVTWIVVSPLSLEALTLCQMSSGTIALRDTCSSQETPLDAGIVNQALQCPPDAVKVGPTCVDKYEASVWSIPSGNGDLIELVQRGHATLTDLTAETAFGPGAATQISRNDTCACQPTDAKCKTGPVFPTSFPETGNWSGALYAASVAGVHPTACVTWFQAEQACAWSGKRLLTNQEWQRAAAGTPDAAPCIVQPVSTDLAGNPTGGTTGTPGCISKWEIYDMVGNVWEWVADWVDAAAHCTNWPDGYGNDVSCVGGPGGGLPGDLWLSLPHPFLRGGSYNDGADAGVFAINAKKASPAESGDASIGFRCAR